MTKPDIELSSEALHLCWGAVYMPLDKCTHDRWSENESLQYINVLEWKVAFFASKIFSKGLELKLQLPI